MRRRPMQGADVRKAREALHWNRPKLAEATGITPGRISRIESGSAIGPEEDAALRDVLAAALEDAPITGAPPGVGAPAPELTKDGHEGQFDKASAPGPEDGPDPMPADPSGFDTGVQVLEEWCGLKQGDTVRLADDPKPWDYEFRRYVKQPEREYVEVKRKGRASPRTVRPDSILKLTIIKRRKVWEPCTTSTP
jgi:transcriptional regulator with XRE-family HTH domain